MKNIFLSLLTIFSLLVVYIVYEEIRGENFDAVSFEKDNSFVPPSEVPKFVSLRGDYLSEEEKSADVILINFWATWCSPCVKELPDMDALKKAVGSDKFRVLAIAVAEDQEKVEAFLKAREFEGLDIRFLPDPDQKITENFKIPGLPSSFLVKPDGETISAVFGIRPWHNKDFIRYINHLIGK